MIHAYNKIYLDDAMHNLGEMFDYAQNSCHMEDMIRKRVDFSSILTL